MKYACIARHRHEHKVRLMCDVLELIVNHRWATREEARRAIFHYIETWYNPKRRHSTIGYVSPATYEIQLQTAA